MSRLSRLLRPTVPFFLIASLIEYIVFHLIYLFSNDFNVIYYYLIFAERFIFLLITLVTAIEVSYEGVRGGRAFLRSLILSLPRLLFLLPFLYVMGVSAMPFDSLEAILIALPTSVIVVLINALAVLLLSFILNKLSRGEKPIRVRPLNLNTKCGFAIFICSLIIFGVNFIIELISTITFIAGEGGVFFISDLIYLAICYVYLAIMLPALQALGALSTYLPREGKTD